MIYAKSISNEVNVLILSISVKIPHTLSEENQFYLFSNKLAKEQFSK